MAVIPAICENCGRAWLTESFISGTGTFTMRGNKVGPCPYCTVGMGRIPDGQYELAGSAVRYLAGPSVSADDLRLLRDLVTTARDTGASEEEIAERIEKEVPAAAGLSVLLKDGGVPLATWITVILTAIAVLLAAHQPKPATPDQIQEIVDRVLNEAEVTGPEQPPERGSQPPRTK
jgi:hypothetical protein